MNHKKLIESLTEEEREELDRIYDEEAIKSVRVSSGLENKGLVTWSQLDIMSGYFEISDPEVRTAYEELKAELLVSS